MIDVWMGAERLTRLLAKSGDNIDHPRRKPGFGCQRGKRKRGQAGLLGWFDHRCVTHRQRRTNRPANDLHRIVPRDDMRTDAVRFTQGVDGVAVKIGYRLAGDLVCSAGVEFEVAGKRPDIGARLTERFANIKGLDSGKVFTSLIDQRRQIHHQAATLESWHPAPWSGKCLPGRGNGLIDICLATPRDVGKWLAA